MIPTTKQMSHALGHLGLNERETAVYLGLLKIGDTNLTTLAKTVHMGRSTVYKVLERLKEKQVATSYTTTAGLRFVPADPNTLLDRAKQALADIQTILPTLQALDGTHPTDTATTVRVFRGALGYRTAIEDSLRVPNTTLYHIGSLAEIHTIKTKHYDLHSYMPKRIKNNIFLRALYFDDTPPEVSDVAHHKYLRDIRYLPSDYKTRGATLIYRDRVLITSSTKSIVTVMIINPTIAESEKKKFEMIWSFTQPRRLPVHNRPRES